MSTNTLIKANEENPIIQDIFRANDFDRVVDDLMSILSIGRNAAYTLIHSHQVRSIRIGRYIRIPRDAVGEYLDMDAA